MSKPRAKTIVITMIVLVLIGGLVYAYSRLNRFEYNDDNATGNTTGNLNNGGTFCEYDGKIYFSNPYDNGKLYSMNSDCSDARKLSDDCVAYINVHNKYIYYVRNNTATAQGAGIFHGNLVGVYRCELDGRNPKALYSEPSGAISLCGNYIYYQHYDDQTALTLYKVKIDGTDNTKISDDEYQPTSYYNGKIYFANLSENHNIFYIDPSNNDRMVQYLEANAYMVDMEGTYLYYIDMSNNYSLMRYNTTNKITEKLIDGRCVHYNLFGSKLFAMIESEEGSGIYRMNVDGSQKEFIAIGNFNNISCTSEYTYFQYYNDSISLYRVPTNGTIKTIEKIEVK